MERPQWKNLNGYWDVAVTERGKPEPAKFDRKILVPFAVESQLSGIEEMVGPEKEVWYQRPFAVPGDWQGKTVLLHFGAVDWKTDVWINGIKIGSHTGGYAPFSFDITPFLQAGGQQKLTVRVWDPTNQGYQPRGKQVARPSGIWYTAVTGIWQTVWLEPVASRHIVRLKTTPDIDTGRITVGIEGSARNHADLFEVKAYDGSKLVAAARGSVTESVDLHIPAAKLWSPESPFLYDLQVTLISGGAVCDQVKSYFAMRKISTKRDNRGIVRLQLNNRDYFQFGPLDQGWWPDGLYTAPSDEALKFDIQKTKDFGFNTIRKHVKVEPARWYTHCDRIGMLVWQDMPSGDLVGGWQSRTMFKGNESSRSAESETHFRREWQEIIDALYNHPCIVTWVPFNEGWGQFKTAEIAEWTKGHDPSRLVNAASGGNHFPVGEMLDLHNYPQPDMYLFDGQRANVLGEYGGIGLAVDNHLWAPERNWGYIQYKTSAEATRAYLEYAEELLKYINAGYSAAIYTQTTDVEIEVNGLMTYDRKVIKLDEAKIREINRKICAALSN